MKGRILVGEKREEDLGGIWHGHLQESCSSSGVKHVKQTGETHSILKVDTMPSTKNRHNLQTILTDQCTTIDPFLISTTKQDWTRITHPLCKYNPQ
jgi:hypothetical protein